MNADLEKIHELLQKLVGLHRQLIETVRAERSALEQVDVKAVQEAVYAKELLIHSLKETELERIRRMAALAASWKPPLVDVSLNQFILFLQGRDKEAADRFRSVYNTLTILVKHVDDQNKENKKLVEKALEHIGAMKRNVLGEVSPHAGTYTQKGMKSDQNAGSRLISKEV